MAKRKGNIRTLPANRVDYILSNYPADIVVELGEHYSDNIHWSEKQVRRAIEAGIKAGARDRRKQELERGEPGSGETFQELLKDWIKTIPSRDNREYLKDKQELRVFAEWLDAQPNRKQELESSAPFIPFKQAKWKDIVGEIRIPLHVMMLKGAPQGSMPIMFADNIMEANVDGEKIAEAGGALFGSVYMKIGENSFGCSGKELLNAFFAWLDEHPDYRDFADGKTPLGKMGE